MICVHTNVVCTITVYERSIHAQYIISHGGDINMNYFEDCLYFSANLLARRLNNIADEAFKSIDITATQGFTLIAIGELDKHTPSEIAAAIQMKPSTITRFLDKLEKSGYVKRTYCGRKSEVDLTQAGTEKLEEVFECWKKIHDANVEVFTEEVANDVTNKIKQANEIYFTKKQ